MVINIEWRQIVLSVPIDLVNPLPFVFILLNMLLSGLLLDSPGYLIGRLREHPFESSMVYSFCLFFTTHHVIKVKGGLWNLMTFPQICQLFFIKI